MTVYAIAQLRLTDCAAYERYQARFLDAFKRFKGRLLATDEKPQVIEGNWDREKIVVVPFPSERDFRDWAGSPAYREIARDRLAGSDAVVLLAKANGP